MKLYYLNVGLRIGRRNKPLRPDPVKLKILYDKTHYYFKLMYNTKSVLLLEENVSVLSNSWEFTTTCGKTLVLHYYI